MWTGAVIRIVTLCITSIFWAIGLAKAALGN
jgi:hypothetical protein